MAQPHKVKRKDLKPGEVLCNYCTAKCCRYFALPIETPETREDYDNMRWYMFHGRVAVFVEDGDWYLLVNHDCQHLQDDNRCGIYEDRPKICRKYTTDECEYDDDAVYDKFFETPEQLWEYADAVLGSRKPKRKFSPRPPRPSEVNLPVVGSVG
jgi:Fe-S-cluster containining protein